MKRLLPYVGSFVAGLIVATAIFLISDANHAREASFASLVQHTHIAAGVSPADHTSLRAVSRPINNDLRIIFMRYSSFSPEERVVLRLVSKRAVTGQLVLEPAVAAKLAPIV